MFAMSKYLSDLENDQVSFVGKTVLPVRRNSRHVTLLATQATWIAFEKALFSQEGTISVGKMFIP